MKRIPGDERGFTLPEVMITIIILGILAGIAIPSWWSIVESRRVDSATNQIVADLRLAHNTASNRLTEYRVAYVSGDKIKCGSSTNADYCLLRKKSDGTWEQTPRFFPERTVLSGTGLNVDAAISTLLASPNARTIKFNAIGTAESGGGLPLGVSDIRVTVASDDDDPSRIVDVNPATSRIKVV